MSDVLPPAPAGAEQPACPGCGAPAFAGSAFCHRCGHPLGAAPPPLAPDASGYPPGPSVFDAPPAAAPTAPPAFGPPAASEPPRGATLPGWGAPAQPPPGPQAPHAAARPSGPSGQPQSAWPYAPGPARGPSPYAAAHAPPAGRSSGAIVVLVVLGAGLVGLAVLGILAAIAIPNFLRYQLRSKASEVPVQLQALDQAELARRELGESYVVFAEGLPAGQDAGQAKLAWADDDLAVVSELAWKPGPATWARYAVDGLEDDEGNQAIALCGETDLDGDGVLAAWAVFRPALAKDGSMVVPPPPAPCSARAALREGASLEFDPAVPPGRVVRLSPDDVF